MQIDGQYLGTVGPLVLTRCPVPTASGLALSLGWLAEEFARDGISIQWVRESDVAVDRFQHAAFNKMRVREGGNITALAERAMGAPTRLIGLTWIDERQAILIRENQEIFEPRHLKGKRVALPAPIGADFTQRAMALQGIRGALAIGGLGFEDIELVEVASEPFCYEDPLSFQRMWSGLDQLADGSLDAVYVKGAAAAEAAFSLGLSVGIDLDVYPSRMTRVNNGTPRPIVVHQDLIEDHFDLTVRLLQQFLRAADWASHNLPALKQILERETLSGPGGVAAAYRNDFHRSLHPDLSNERIELLAMQEVFLRENGFINGHVDIDTWVDRRPLEAAIALHLQLAA